MMHIKPKSKSPRPVQLLPTAVKIADSRKAGTWILPALVIHSLFDHYLDGFPTEKSTAEALAKLGEPDGQHGSPNDLRGGHPLVDASNLATSLPGHLRYHLHMSS